MVFQFEWERDLILFLQELITKWPFAKGLFIFFTYFGEPVFAVAVVGFLYWGYKKEWGRYLILCVMGTQLFTNMLKNTFLRLRPYMADEKIACLKAPESQTDLYDPYVQGFSFPSGHSACISSFATALGLHLKNKRVDLVMFVLTLLVGISRLALGVHYPTDVLTGILLGIVSVFLIDRLYKKVKIETLYLLFLSIGIAGTFFCRSEDYYSVFGLSLGFMAGERFEERFIGFKNTDVPIRMLLRTVLGAAVFLGVDLTCKSLFALIGTDQTMIILLLRSLRYVLSCFAAMGLYPYLFSYGFLK
ncbi:MAG: phosphatase PAP2 family protein [Erysipelotrichaceae bacterium]|nr:phosphatase PAP2 family protein [Erysipelotrichaceae bacterium]